MATKKKLNLTFSVNEDEGSAPFNYDLSSLLRILDSDLAEMCFGCDDDLAQYDAKEIARIAKKAIITIGRMGRLFN